METLTKHLQKILDRITGRKADLAKSRRRHKVFLGATERNHEKQINAEQKGHPLRAAAFKRRAEHAHKQSRYWLERVRRDDAAIEALEAIEAKLVKEEAEWLASHAPRFEGENRIRGGTYEERSYAAQVRAMKNYSEGTQPGYYSQEGASRVYSHTLWHYPHGHIWDCSTYGDGTKFVTGDPSPSGPAGFTEGGYTGTELEFCGRVTGKVEVGDLVVYLRYAGDGIGHHVEVVLDPDKKQTSGHGDSAINIGCNGSWDIFGDGLYVIVRAPRHAKKAAVHAGGHL